MPKEKRLFGYFALPVLVGDEIVAALDLKTDRQNRKLLMQKWSWVGSGAPRGARKGSEAPHRGRAAPLRAVSTGGGVRTQAVAVSTKATRVRGANRITKS